MKRYPNIRLLTLDERGAALVEFTLVLPFLLFLAAGLSEFGLMLHQQQIITKSVRDAARYAARVPVASPACVGFTSQQEWSGLVTNTQTLALYGSLNTSDPLLLSTWNSASMVSVTVPSPCPLSPAGSPSGETVAPVILVTASAPYAGVGFLGFLGLSSFNLTASHREMWTGL